MELIQDIKKIITSELLTIPGVLQLVKPSTDFSDDTDSIRVFDIEDDEPEINIHLSLIKGINILAVSQEVIDRIKPKIDKILEFKKSFAINVFVDEVKAKKKK
ncbi:hypothetical protein STIUS_v1c02220 [Spiroplasma sp. TIUS-1]|uniref:hypothetical protein n=1 Tax=Spiroplasma sp. TIUS-1 TaxID=216963 RepID=UPI001399065F|nr:hypothetical protein [Spiroplasma sp. TIUS-1]QHX35777.1 hypothetical protein STIUS_v1c02220 [Spiroplasma sp. TIUS-1]